MSKRLAVKAYDLYKTDSAQNLTLKGYGLIDKIKGMKDSALGSGTTLMSAGSSKGGYDNSKAQEQQALPVRAGGR